MCGGQGGVGGGGRGDGSQGAEGAGWGGRGGGGNVEQEFDGAVKGARGGGGGGPGGAGGGGGPSGAGGGGGPSGAGGSGGANGPGNTPTDSIGSNGATSATALDGRVNITGDQADRVAEIIENLYANSPTFAQYVDSTSDTVNITSSLTAGGGIAGTSTVGAGNETVDLNFGDGLGDDWVTALTSHELLHAFGDLPDGPEIGQINSQIGYELGYISSPSTGTVFG
jgi:hypothetical protein